MKHLINPLDFSVEETEELLLLAEDIAKDRSRYSEVCHGKSWQRFSMSQAPEPA